MARDISAGFRVLNWKMFLQIIKNFFNSIFSFLLSIMFATAVTLFWGASDIHFFHCLFSSFSPFDVMNAFSHISIQGDRPRLIDLPNIFLHLAKKIKKRDQGKNAKFSNHIQYFRKLYFRL